MKIAMIGHKRIPSREGGIEVVVEELSTRMVNKGNQVTCYNRGGKHVLDKHQKLSNINEYKGITLKKVPTIDYKGLAAMTSSFSGTLKILFSSNDVVHYHAEGPCAMIPIIKFFSKKKVIATIHGLDWQRAKWGGFATKYIKFGEKMAVKYADEIIVLSENMQQYFSTQYNRSTRLIRNGVNEPELLDEKLLVNKWNLHKDEYILFLGRLVPEKGIHYLIEAYSKLNTNKKLVIAGAASDTSEYYAELKEMAKNNPNIIFTGFVQGENLQALYSNAYLYVLPSDLEGMPLSLLEAMSYSNCCVTSDIPECKNVIQDKGVIFNKGDVNDLQHKLQHLIDNENIVNDYREDAKKYVLANYNWNNIVDDTLKLYEGY